jgi:phage gpG-like protein
MSHVLCLTTEGMPHWTIAIQRLQQLKADIPKLAANEMVNFALDNIRKESWEGRKWQKRKPGTRRDRGRGLLVDTGDGRRSIEAKPVTGGALLTANEYMAAHNDGVNKTVSVRGHRRKGADVSAHSRNMNLPQRQFAGKSKEQDDRITKIINNRIVKALT